MAEHDRPPDNELPDADPETGWLYQPLESGGRDKATETFGLDASYLNGLLVPVPVLPAASVQLALTVALVESGPEYVAGEHDKPPEKELADSTIAATGWLYQPFESGERDNPTETVGFDASYLKGLLMALAVLPALSVQVPLTVALVESGPEYVVDGEHEAIPEKELPLNENATGWLYQPLESGGWEGVADAVGEEISRLIG